MASGSGASKRVGVLVSGRGTNLQALIDAGIPISVVISNIEGAQALDRARQAGILAVVVSHRAFSTREAFEDALMEALAERAVGWVVLAGFMRLLTPHFLERFAGRVINIHPSLLPAFPGVDAQRQAIEYGVKIAGVTVHFVDAGTDTGPVILQEAVAVLDDDSAESLAARLLDVEHRVFVRAVRLAIEGRLRRDGRRVRIVEG